MKLIPVSILAASLILFSQNLKAQTVTDKHPVTDAEKIADALSAGPEFITKNATILDWPGTPSIMRLSIDCCSATAIPVYPSMIGSSTPRPSMKSHSAGAGVPTGRVRRAFLAAILGSSMSHAAWRRSRTRKVAAVAAP